MDVDVNQGGGWMGVADFVVAVVVMVVVVVVVLCCAVWDPQVAGQKGHAALSRCCGGRNCDHQPSSQ